MKFKPFATAAAAALALAVTGCGVDPVDPVADDESTSAEVMCEEFIEKRLKAPATADYTDPTTSKDGATYTVAGAVDSENGFGAKIRTRYVCVVRSDGDDMWTLVDLDLGDK